MIVPETQEIAARNSSARAEKPLRLLNAWYLAACVVLAVFAFAFNWATGHRGVFLLDQSMILDGGWRILQGQTLYKDLIIPFGPITFYIQAFFLQLFGFNWAATVLPACVLNTLAALSVIRIVRLLGGESRLLALASGLATAICFQAPFGTLWLEQTAMFFDLMALQAMVESLHASDRRRMHWQLASGLSLGLAVLSKQNYGFFFVPVVLILAAADLADIRRTCRTVLHIVTAMAATLAVFVGWVWVFSDLSSFVQSVLVTASEIGRTRMTPEVVWKALTFDTIAYFSQMDLAAVAAGAIALAVGAFNLLVTLPRKRLWCQTLPLSGVAILLPYFRSLTQASTLNEWQNNFAFVGLAVGLGLSLVKRMRRGLQPESYETFRGVIACLMIAAGIWSALVLYDEAGAAWGRTVQQFAPGATFTETVRVPGMESVQWGEPTPLRDAGVLQKADFEAVTAYLSEKRKPFFVMGDSTLLYGLLGARSPQPLLYFLPGHAFRPTDIPRIDDMVASSLERNGVGIVVREKVTHLPEIALAYMQFPKTWAWFKSRFVQVSEFGNYEVWERRVDGPR